MDINKFKNTPLGSKLDPETFCILPWAGLAVTTSSSQPGENENKELGINYKVCCKYKTPMGFTLDEFRANPELEELRQAFLNGEKHPNCNRCWEDEAAGLPSRRNFSNIEIPPEEFDFNEVKPLWITALHSTSCNLACRICDSNSSSKWQTENKKHPELKTDTWNKTYHHYKNQGHMDDLVESASNVRKFTWYGGEPLLGGQAQHLEMIDQLPRNMTLEYLTNITQLPNEKLLEKWKEFDNVLLCLSIDGIEDYFEYNRWPAKWNETLEKFEYYKELAKDSNISLRLNYAVTVLNVLHLPDFIRWATDYGFSSITLPVVMYPLELNIRNLLSQTKDVVYNKLIETQNIDLINIAKYMISEDLSHRFADTKKKVFTVDATRNQSFEELFPDDASILGLIDENKRTQ